jgi:hypothetical protein
MKQHFLNENCDCNKSTSMLRVLRYLQEVYIPVVVTCRSPKWENITIAVIKISLKRGKQLFFKLFFFLPFCLS